MTYRFELPIYVYVGNKKVSLNMNTQRNAHFYLKNAVKQSYYPTKFEKFKAKKISVSYTLVWNNMRRTDRMNWVSIADKFFLDWLVMFGYIDDDDMNHYVETVSRQVIDKAAKESHIIAEVTVIE